MQEVESSWRRIGDWKSRYSKLYTSPKISINPKHADHCRISFMNNDKDPYTMLLKRMRSFGHDSITDHEPKPESSSPRLLTSSETTQSTLFNSNKNSEQSYNLGVHDTMLLDLVRMRSCDIRESQDKTLELVPRDQDNESEYQTSEACIHGLNMRMTERSMSRSRVSRVSTRRDMDIPSILAFTAMFPAPQAQCGIPAFQRVPSAQSEELPRWSIRRSVCPVCSQKWRDRSSLANIKYSGLKRNSSVESPSVTAPARLKTSITREYAPRPLSPEVKEQTVSRSSFRNTGTTWQLVRARRLRVPKSLIPSDDARIPKSITLQAKTDLDQRVKRFLLNNQS